MKESVGFDFEGIDLDLLSLADLQDIRARLTNHYKYISTFPHCGKKRMLLNKYIQNHARLMTTPARNLQQCMALAIQHIPATSSASARDMNTVLVTYLRQALKNEAYKGAQFKDLLEMVTKNQRILDFSNDWDASVQKMYRAVAAENLHQAWDILQDLSALHTKCPKNTDQRYASYILCSQIVNLIDVLSEINQDHLFFDSVAEFYSEASKQLKVAIENFKALTNKQAQPSVYERLRGIFFSCMNPQLTANLINAKFSKRETVRLKRSRGVQDQG